jgi:hypothetical protein
MPEYSLRLRPNNEREVRMGQYGQAAVRAVESLSKTSADTPRKAWEEAIRKLTTSTSSQKKQCPKFVFLGLCEEGLVKGIEVGDYAGSEKTRNLYLRNKECAIQAVDELRKNPSLAKNGKKLWSIVGNGESDTNGQMDVVLALWNGGLINK